LKVLFSTACVVISIPAAFIHTYISLSLFALSSGIWIIPSKEIEEELSKTN
jgi:hypothetical protein